MSVEIAQNRRRVREEQEMAVPSKQEIEVHHAAQAPLGEPMTPMVMLDRALSAGAGPEVLEKFMALHERWEAGQARKAFDAAIAAAKAEIPPVVRQATGHNSKKYADFASIARHVDPVISRHGLSYRFRTHQDDMIRVTCVLSHREGHAEETTLAGPPDKTGNKNDIQAIGSTLTYLQRYSLMQALGLAAADDDDGAAAANGEKISAAQLATLKAAIDQSESDERKFCEFAGVAKLEDLPAANFDQAMRALETARAVKAKKRATDTGSAQ